MNSTTSTTSRIGRPSATETILTAWFIAGSLDLLAAILVYSVAMQKTTDTKLLQGIGKAAFGSNTFDSQISLALSGVLVHFFIALCFTIFYFFIFPYIPLLKKQRIISGLVYGIFVWCVMNLLVLPLLHIANIPTKWDSITRGALILMFCIGLPISLIVSRYYMLKAIKKK